MERLPLRLRWDLLVTWLWHLREYRWAGRPWFLLRRRVVATFRGAQDLPTILPDGDDVWACPWHLTNVTAIRADDGRPMGDYRRCQLPREIRVPCLSGPMKAMFGDAPLAHSPQLGFLTYTFRRLPDARTAEYV